jgi:hypothetical protein
MSCWGHWSYTCLQPPVLLDIVSHSSQLGSARTVLLFSGVCVLWVLHAWHTNCHMVLSCC